MDLRIAPLGVQTQAVDKLREAIVSGHFLPGQRLVEAELCRALGISRGSVREALRRLEGERLVVITPHRGPSVTELSWEEASQIYDVRALLEGEAAALAARRATAAQREAMDRALTEFDVAVAAEDVLGRIQSTARFYDAVLAACGNGVIEEMLRGLLARIALLRGRSMSRQGRSVHSAREMRAILDAIRARTPAVARRAAAQHVHAARDAAKEAMSERRVA
jgi:DNA-binding GntR family transcriptional regulator